MKSKNVLRWLSCIVLAGSMSQAVQAEGWNLGGYVKTGYTLDSDLRSVSVDGTDGFFRGNSQFLGNTFATPGNQVELTANRKFEAENGATGTLYLRAEYGNGTDYENVLYSSGGGEGEDGPIFEVKEAFIEMEKLDFLPEGAKIWAGRRFYGRNSSALSGEFWKQTSGVGVGYDAGKFAVAFVGVDPDGAKTNKTDDKQTTFALDTRYRGIEVPGGNLELQFNYYMRPSAEGTKNDADSGFAIGLTYNINGWYGLNGWSQAGLAYGKGLGGLAKGLNFGNWVTTANEDAMSIYATTYGMWNVNDKVQMGTEVSLHMGEEIYGSGSDGLTRFGMSANPSYKVNNNLRMTLEASFGYEKAEAWGADLTTFALTVAPVITINNDYYGRPQIKPFVTYVSQSNDDPKYNNWTYEHDGESSGTFFGVQAEVWF